MLKIKDNKISLTRGDTCYLDVVIMTSGGKPYQSHEGDKVVFSVKRNIDDMDYAFQKEFNVGETIEVTPKDTERLNCGRYWYDVQLTTSLGEVFTIIEKTSFCLKEEVSK